MRRADDIVAAMYMKGRQGMVTSRSRVSLGRTAAVMAAFMVLLSVSLVSVPQSSVHARALNAHARVETLLPLNTICRRISGGPSSFGRAASQSVGCHGAHFVDFYRVVYPQFFSASKHRQHHFPPYWKVIFVAMAPKCPAPIAAGQRLFVQYEDSGMWHERILLLDLKIEGCDCWVVLTPATTLRT